MLPPRPTEIEKSANERTADADAPKIARLIAEIRSPVTMERAAAQLAACGPRAIPALRALLFERDTAGLFEPRRQAVWVLASLHAYGILLEFLATSREATDPVEQVGDEAVMNAAARGLRNVDDDRVFPLLRSIAERKLLPGVVETLGTYRRSETLPILIASLADDDARPAAAAALREFGDRARQALLCAAASTVHEPGYERACSRRGRRSALQLLRALGIEREDWPIVRELIKDPDPRIALVACDIALDLRMAADETVRRLVAMTSSTDIFLNLEIEDCLVRHYEIAHDTTQSLLSRCERSIDGPPETRKLLRRVASRVEAPLEVKNTATN